MKNKKNMFEQYSDGVFKFGIYEETYDQLGNAALKKEFILKGKLFFEYSSIREQDKLKYDNTGISLKLKLKVKFNKIVNTDFAVNLNDELYAIKNIDRDVKGKNLYLYLTEFKLDMNKHIAIYKRSKQEIMEDEAWTHYRTVWGNIESITSVNNKEVIVNDNIKSKLQKLFTIRYLEELDIDINKKATMDYKIKYKNTFYNISQITNIEERDKLFAIKGEMS